MFAILALCNGVVSFRQVRCIVKLHGQDSATVGQVMCLPATWPLTLHDQKLDFQALCTFEKLGQSSQKYLLVSLKFDLNPQTEQCAGL